MSVMIARQTNSLRLQEGAGPDRLSGNAGFSFFL